MNKIIIFLLFCYYLIAQVTPFKLPENILIKQKSSIDISNYFEFNFNDSDKYFVYDSNNHIWQKTFSLNSSERVFVEFDDETCGNNLFLINDKKEFSGPYDLKSFKKTNKDNKRAFDFAISSGGMNAIAELTHAALPCALVPLGHPSTDQEFNINLFARQGLGIPVKAFDTKALESAIETLLNKKKREQMQQLQNKWTGGLGAEKAAKSLIEFINS